MGLATRKKRRIYLMVFRSQRDTVHLSSQMVRAAKHRRRNALSRLSHPFPVPWARVSAVSFPSASAANTHPPMTLLRFYVEMWPTVSPELEFAAISWTRCWNRQLYRPIKARLGEMALQQCRLSFVKRRSFSFYLVRLRKIQFYIVLVFKNLKPGLWFWEWGDLPTNI